MLAGDCNEWSGGGTRIMTSKNSTSVADIDLSEVDPATLEMMIGLADKAPEPGAVKMDNPRSRVVTAGLGDEGMPQIVSALKSAGWSYIYRIENGKREITNNNMLLTNLRKTVDNKPGGKPVFTTHAPGTPLSPVNNLPASAPTLHKCLLHPEHPNREYLDEIGLAGQACRKSTLPSPYQVAQHMVKKHKMELATIDKDKTDKREQRAEDRADRNERFQREVLGERATPQVAVEEPTGKTYTLDCPECGEEWEYDKDTRLKGYSVLRRHRKQEHGVIAQRKPKAELENTDD